VAWLSAWNSVEALCKPSVDVQSQGRMGQPGEGSFIEGDGVVLEAGHPPVIEPLVPQSSSIAPFLDLSPPSNVPLGASERLSTGFLCPYLWPTYC